VTVAGTRPSAILDRAAVAARLGIHPDHVTRLARRTEKLLGEGHALRPEDFPPPDVRLGQGSGWYEATIVAYEQHRRSVGRPRKVG